MPSPEASSDWRDLLIRLGRELVRARVVDLDGVPLDGISADWLGFPGAAEEEIADAERRLGCSLPPSYRAFLRTSNGFLRAGVSAGQLWSTREVDWFRERHADPVAVFTEPADEYLTELGAILERALEVSEYEDGVVPLDPETRDADGEWGAFF